MIPSYLYTASFPTGSSYICNPPVLDTDIDHMFLVDDLEKVSQVLEKLGWKRCGNEEYQIGKWVAYRKDNLNALLTDNLDHFNKFLQATEEAKKLNLLDKKDRIALFDKYLNPRKQISKYDTVYMDNIANEWIVPFREVRTV